MSKAWHTMGVSDPCRRKTIPKSSFLPPSTTLSTQPGDPGGQEVGITSYPKGVDPLYRRAYISTYRYLDNVEIAVSRYLDTVRYLDKVSISNSTGTTHPSLTARAVLLSSKCE